MYTEFDPDRLRFVGLIPERLIFLTPKVKFNTLSACGHGTLASYLFLNCCSAYYRFQFLFDFDTIKYFAYAPNKYFFTFFTYLRL